MKNITFTAEEINGKRDLDMVLYRLKQVIPEKDIEVKSITINYEPFDWISHIEKKIEHNKLVLDLLKSGHKIEEIEAKTITELNKLCQV